MPPQALLSSPLSSEFESDVHKLTDGDTTDLSDDHSPRIVSPGL